MSEVESISKDAEAAIIKLREDNVKKLQALQSMQLNVDAGSIANTRLSIFLDMFLDNDARLAYELKFEQVFGQNLDELLSKARQMQLLAGGSVPPQAVPSSSSGLFVPNK